jgi:hypothetical protein
MTSLAAAVFGKTTFGIDTLTTLYFIAILTFTSLLADGA